MGGQIPQRIEVLLKKASVDPVFRTAFLERRGEMAQEIGLSLEPAEAAMLRAVRREQLEAIIARTSVPEEHRRTFLGQAAAAMLAALGIVAGGPGSAAEPNSGSAIPDPMFGGVRPDAPPRPAPPDPVRPGGCRPDLPDKKPKTIEQRVIGVIAKQLKVNELLITTNKKPLESLLLVEDLAPRAGAGATENGPGEGIHPVDSRRHVPKGAYSGSDHQLREEGGGEEQVRSPTQAGRPRESRRTSRCRPQPRLRRLPLAVSAPIEIALRITQGHLGAAI